MGINTKVATIGRIRSLDDRIAHDKRAAAYMNALISMVGSSPEEFIRESDFPIHTFLFRHQPAGGDILSFTYGLSEIQKPSWSLGKPELSVCLASRDESWALAAADVVDRFHDTSNFSVGTILDFGEPISENQQWTCF